MPLKLTKGRTVETAAAFVVEIRKVSTRYVGSQKTTAFLSTPLRSETAVIRRKPGDDAKKPAWLTFRSSVLIKSQFLQKARNTYQPKAVKIRKAPVRWKARLQL